MGGSAFGGGPSPLFTPRMPPAVYARVREHCHGVLSLLFVMVATPIDGPGKTSFGDVDIVLAVPTTAAISVHGNIDGILAEAARRLGAVRSISPGAGKASLAIPWPKDHRDSEAPLPGPPSPPPPPPPPPPGDVSRAAEPAVPPPPAFVQVDLTAVASPDAMHWMLFKHAHGDFWNIVGTCIRPLGLTVDEQALWLRVPEIEHAHRPRSKVLLTDEPASVLSFLGLRILADASSVDSLWERPFANAQSLFDYVTTCTWFELPPEDDSGGSGGSTGFTGYGVPFAALSKSNDRRRMNSRPLFRQWALEFIPAAHAQRRASPSATAATSAAPDSLSVRRARLRDAAFAQFPGVQTRYEATRAAWLRERHTQDIRTAVKAAVPAHLPSQYRGIVCAAVRRHLGLTGSDPASIDTVASAWTVDGVTAFVQSHWQSLAEAAAPAEHTRYLASLQSG